MPSASSVSSTRRRIAVVGEAEVLEHEREVALDVVDDELRLGVLGDEPDDVGELAWVVRASWSGRTRSTSPPKRPPLACGTSPFAARSSVLLPEPDGPTTSRSSPGSTSRSTSSSAAADASGYANVTARYVDRAHDALRSRSRTRGRAAGAARARAARCSVGQRSVDVANHMRLPSPAIEHDRERDRRERASRPRPASRPCVMRRGPVADALRCSTTRARPPTTSPTAPAEPEHRRAACGARRRARRTRRRARAATRRRTSPPTRSRAPAPSRANPRASIDSASVTARSMPELEHGHDLAQQPTASHDASAGAGAVGLADVARSP